MKEKIAFVVQRYGLEVNGGAELHCRQLAEHLLKYYDIDIFTTKAIDYMTWKDEYQKNIEIINGITVRRFSVERERNRAEFDEINSLCIRGDLPEDREKEWIEKQGPYVPKLISCLIKNKNQYKAVIFFTYLYYTTAIGIQEFQGNSILIPTAHDEVFLNLKNTNRIFMSPKGIFYNTEEEKRLVVNKFNNSYIYSDIGGVGVDIPDDINIHRFKEKYKLQNYIIYVGRIDEGKNCNILFQYFLEYKKRNKNDLKLVLMGKPVIEIPKSNDIIPLGFVSDQDKFDGIAGSKALVLPSRFESLSMVVLEALALQKPVILNEECDVLKAHCIKSNAGLYYRNYFEFEGELNYLLNNPNISKVMGENGKKYVDDNYRWDIIIEKLLKMIEYVSK